ncbi:MAG: hypothetical protein ACJ8MH_11725 [Povalibacter sp.]
MSKAFQIFNPLRVSLPLIGILGLGTATWVKAVENISFQVAHVQGAGWKAEGVSVQLDLPTRTSATVRVSRLKLDSMQQELRNVSIECPRVEITGTTISCPQARLLGDFGDLGKQDVQGSASYGRIGGSLSMRLAGLSIAKGKATLTASLAASGWDARIQLDAVGSEPLLKFAQQAKVVPEGFSVSGVVSGRINARGAQASVNAADLDVRVQALTASNAEGTLATDKLTFEIQAKTSRTKGVWSYDATIRSNEGQAYAQPIFLDFGAHAIDVQARGSWAGGDKLTVDAFRLNHRNVADAEGRATIDLAAEQPVQALEMKLSGLQFPGAYDSYFQPWLLDTSFKSVKTAGAISGSLHVAAGEPREIGLKFADVSMDDGNRNFVLNGLSGEWHWAAGASAANDDDESPARMSTSNSRIKWDSGVLLNLDLGHSELTFNTQGSQFRLLQPASIPLVDGALELESFRVRNAGQPNVAFMVDATIRPISVALLCKAFGWPEFGGRVGGTISKLRMRENVITLGTTLKAQVFDGSISINDLRLEQPFSQWPRFAANIALDNLDLNLVTSAFSFGGMTGRLSGSIDGLQLFNWQPVAFDARLYTPPGDRSRHRISQRAVQNIGSIGGGGAGVTAALSGGVMKFFDDFNYERLGLSCRLENDVCIMDGVAPAPNGGYYLVKGKGLPRIDVIGGAHRVDWPRLVQQLIAVTQSEGPVVE